MLTIAGLAGAVAQAPRRVVRGRFVRPIVAHPEPNRLRVGPVDAVVHRFAQLLAALRTALRRPPVADADEVQAAHHVRMGLRRLIVRRFRHGDRALQDSLAGAAQPGDAQDSAELRRRAGQNRRRRQRADAHATALMLSQIIPSMSLLK